MVGWSRRWSRDVDGLRGRQGKLLAPGSAVPHAQSGAVQSRWDRGAVARVGVSTCFSKTAPHVAPQVAPKVPSDSARGWPRTRLWHKDKAITRDEPTNSVHRGVAGRWRAWARTPFLEVSSALYTGHTVSRCA